MVDKEAIGAYIQEYETLCHKHKMYIGSCGCCGSPWVINGSGPENDIALSSEDIKKTIKHLREIEDCESKEIENG
jgi:hypothetical protein